MSIESFLTKKLQKFSILDVALIKLVYMFVGFLVCSLYSKLGLIDWWFYLILAVIAALPLMIHEFSVKGSLYIKLKNYVKTNTPSNQVLLFLSIFLFACMLCVIFPFLANYEWWHYVIAIVILAIKPCTKNMYW